MLYYIFIYFICGIICALCARSKGRSVIGWFFIGFFFTFIGLIIILVLSNLKDARAKEVHAEMEQRRLREQLRQERLKNEQFRKHTHTRLDSHDEALQMDTRSDPAALDQRQINMLDDGSYLIDGEGQENREMEVEPENYPDMDIPLEGEYKIEENNPSKFNEDIEHDPNRDEDGDY